MLRTYRTGSWPIRAAASRSTLLNHTFGSSFSASASRRNDWIAPGPMSYAAKANRLWFCSSNGTPLNEWDALEIVIHQLCHVFGAAMDVGIGFVNVADVESAAGFRHQLHQANRTGTAAGALVETRFLIALRHQ